MGGRETGRQGGEQCRQQLRQRVTILVEAKKKTSPAPNSELERNALNYSVWELGIENDFLFCAKKAQQGKEERKNEREEREGQAEAEEKASGKLRGKYEEHIIQEEVCSNRQ